MSAVGIDLSTDNCGVAYIPVDNITYRDASKDNPAAICFDGNHRIIGKLATGEPNCFSQVMKTIGKTKSDLNPEPELSTLLQKGPDDLLRIRVSDGQKDLQFTATQLLAMIISDLKATAEMAIEVDDIGDCCIGIPGYFTESQRTAVRQAAEIAGLQRVSLLEATTAIALGHGILRKNVHQHSAEFNIIVVDIGPSATQVSTVSLKSEGLDVLSFAYDLCTSEESFVDDLAHYFEKTSECSDDVTLREVCRGLKQQSKIMEKKETLMYGGKQMTRSKFEAVCAPTWGRMKVLVEEAVTDAGVEKEKISKILVSGSGAKICGIEQMLENLFPRQPKAGEKHVILARDSVAKGCAIHCAITSKAFKDGQEHLRHKKMKERLLKFKVSDKWPLVKDKTKEFQVGDASDGRCELTRQELNDARECERKMVVREKIRVGISNIFKAKDFVSENEIRELNDFNGQLENEDLDKEYLRMKSVEKVIMARKDEHENSRSVSKSFTKKVSEYEGFLKSKDPKYSTVKKTAKDSFEEDCKQATEWLRLKLKSLSQKSSKSDDPIYFIDDAIDKLEYLEQAWDAAQKEREPDVEVLEYTIKDRSTFRRSIDDFRANLLKGTKKKEIKGCFLLPFQTEVGGVPYKWFHVVLHGRNKEATTLHVKHHNAYNMAFSNKEGQPYEMGPGYRPAKKKPDKEPGQEQSDGEEPDEQQADEQQYDEQPGGEEPDGEKQPDEPAKKQPDKEPGQEQPDGDQPDEQQPDKEPGQEQPDQQQNISSLFCPTIPGSKYAGFNCDYMSMINPMKLKWTNEELMKRIEEFEVGIEPWQNSIHVLSYHGCDPDHHKTCKLCRAPHAVQRSVMCISIMLNECTRMDALKNPIGDGLSLCELLMEFIWHWRIMSRFLRNWDATKKVTTLVILLTVAELTYVYNADEVGEIMHLILNVTSAGKESDIDDQGPPRQLPPSGGDAGDKNDSGNLAGPPSPSAPGRDAATKEQPQPQPPIRPGHNLLQIFSIDLEDLGDSDISDILVHEERGTHVMYSCGGEESTGSHNFRLSGPSIAISSESGSILELVPKTENTVQKKKKNTGNPYGALMHLDGGLSCYDQHRLKTMPYGNGRVLVSYAILTEAVEANLEIDLLVPSDGLTYNVSGILGATQQTGTSKISVCRAEYVSYSRGGPLNGMCGLPISSIQMKVPLSPSVIAVKLGDCIRVQGAIEIEICERVSFAPLGHCKLQIDKALEIPRKIGFIKTVETPWIGEGDECIWYRVSMTLISRNI